MIHQSITGWITPCGEFIPCERFQHRRVLKNHPEVEKIGGLKDWIESEDSNLKSIEQSCQDLSDKDEHPEWHCLELAVMDFENEFLLKLYEYKFIRVGTLKNTVFFEGTKEALSDPDIRQKCKDFAENNDMDYKFEPK